jgi:F-type H+-transporting ATPase subunit beta
MAMLKGFSQLLHVIEQFTGMPGRYVRIRNTLREFSEILGRTNDHVPEQAFYVQEGSTE